MTDRARSVYLDHVARLEGVAQEVVANGSLSGRMGDGLVSHRGVRPEHPSPWQEAEEGSASKRRRVCPEVLHLG